AFAGLAVMFVGGIAERQNREAQVWQFRRLAAFQELEETLGRLRRVALAVGATDDDEILLILEAARLVIGHIGKPRLDAFGLGGFDKRLGQALAVSRLAAEQDRQESYCRRGGQSLSRLPLFRRGVRHHRRNACLMTETGEIAADPDRLIT